MSFLKQFILKKSVDLVTSHLIRLSQDRLDNIFFQMGSLIPDEYRIHFKMTEIDMYYIL